MARPAKVTAGFKTELEDGLSSIMFMPEGTHEITAMIGGRVQTREVNVSEDVLAAFQDGLESRKQKNVRPFGGFDHKTGEAAFIPTAFRYEQGRGLMLDIEWTEAGQKAIEGRNYSYFSPTFALRQDGTPAGIFQTGEVGSLVNEPAFQEIERIAASQAEDPETEPEKAEAMGDGRGHMLHQLGLIEEDQIDSEDAMEMALKRMESFRKAEAALASTPTDTDMSEDIEKAKAAQKKAEADKVEAQAALDKLQSENDELKQKLETVEAESKKRAEEAADAAIDEAVKAGRIGPKDEDLQAFWKRTVLGDPEAYKALASLPAAPIDGKTLVAHKGEEPKEELKGHAKVVAAFQSQETK